MNMMYLAVTVLEAEAVKMLYWLYQMLVNYSNSLVKRRQEEVINGPAEIYKPRLLKKKIILNCGEGSSQETNTM